ncbi:hypothetical protein [Aliamphritea spongicola]|nr:hypothetical protein [Aliamphritea spongicola]
MVGLLSAIEPLRVANRFAGREIFRWQLLSDDGESVNACNQLAIQQTQSIQEVETPKNLFVCASFNPEKYINETTLSWLKNSTAKVQCSVRWIPAVTCLLLPTYCVISVLLCTGKPYRHFRKIIRGGNQ